MKQLKLHPAWLKMAMALLGVALVQSVMSQCNNTKRITGSVNDGGTFSKDVTLNVSDFFSEYGQNASKTFEAIGSDGVSKFSCQFDKSTFDYHKRLVSAAPSFELIDGAMGPVAKVTDSYNDGAANMNVISYGQAVGSDWCLVCLLTISSESMEKMGKDCVDQIFTTVSVEGWR